VGLVIFSSKRVEKIGPIYILKYLMGSDLIYLLFLVLNYSTYTFNKDISTLSLITCKLYFYFNYALDPISGILLVYISIDRYVSLTHPSRRKFLRKHSTQFIFFLITIIFNFCFYIPASLYTELTLSDKNRSVCNWLNLDVQTTALLIDTANRLVLPFVAMLICNVLLIYTIFKSRRTVSASLSNANVTLKNDIKFAITSIFLNFVYIFLNIPVILSYTVFFNIGTDIFYFFSFYLWYMCYAVNFYLILFTNSLVRKEFVSKIIIF